tara:strand:- start:315 stop:437 length:123 start_codon:yes stop_codon:yes gene_type:complete
MAAELEVVILLLELRDFAVKCIKLAILIAVALRQEALLLG